MEKIAILENEVEGQILGSLLTERGIEHNIVPPGDRAYGGIFQQQKGWGHVEAAPEHKQEIEALLADMRSEEESS